MIIAIIILLVIILCGLGYIKSLLAQKETLLRQANMKRLFMKNISNEIRVPLRDINHAAPTIAEEGLYLSKSEKQAIAHRIVNNAGLIETLLDEIQVFSEGENVRLPLVLRTINPNFLCNRCVEENQISKKNDKVKLQFVRQMNNDFTIRTDPRLVELILNKLIQNSLRFTKEGEVTVGCNTTELYNRLVIFVQDTGVGIPENRKGMLFNWFEKPDDMFDEAELDLSIAQKLADQLDGAIQLDESVQRGTRIRIVLPLK